MENEIIKFEENNKLIRNINIEYDKFIITIGIEKFTVTAREYIEILNLKSQNKTGLYFIERTGESIVLEKFSSAKKIESKEPKIFGEDIKI